MSALCQKRTSHALLIASSGCLNAATNPYAIHDDIAAGCCRMYDSRCRYRTDNRRAPWRYATGSCNASGTNYRIGSVVSMVIVALNAAMAIVASKIERIVGSLVKNKRFCWWTNF